MDKRKWIVEEYIQMQVQKQVNDVLEKIRAEIIQIPTISSNANDIYKADVLVIIDKYMGRK